MWTHAEYCDAGRRAEEAWEARQAEFRQHMVEQVREGVPANSAVGWKADRARFGVNGVRRVPAAARLDKVYSGGYDVVDRIFHDKMHLDANLLGKHAWTLVGDTEHKMCAFQPRPTDKSIISQSPAGDPLRPLKTVIFSHILLLI
jgi:anti-sigma factor RsiW